MARIKIGLPEQFPFSTAIPIRITDLNYGNHVGNDAVLSLIHEARMQFLKHFNYTEMNFGGAGMIMSDAAIEFKNVLFYGDTVIVSVACSNIGKVNFDIFYKLEKDKDGQKKLVAVAKTGMVCYDYAHKKVVAIPEEARKNLQ